MTNTLPHWTHEEIIDLYAKASGLYGTLTGLTETPREAAEIIMMMHVLLFMNCGDGSATCEKMLEDYCKNFKGNYDAQTAFSKGQMN